MEFVRESLIRHEAFSTLRCSFIFISRATFPHRGRHFGIRLTLGEQSEKSIYAMGDGGLAVC